MYIVVIIAQVSKLCYSSSGTINSNNNKKLEEQVKQLSLKIKKLENENQYLLGEMNTPPLRTNIKFEYCKLRPDNICGPCSCKDDAKVSQKYYWGCQNLQPRRDCLEHKQAGRKVDRLYKIHQNILKIIQV